MITAKQLFDKMLLENDECTSTEMMIEFAQMHVNEALKQANKNTKTGTRDSCGDIQADLIEKYILNAYPLDKLI
jgi:hypothetical protein